MFKKRIGIGSRALALLLVLLMIVPSGAAGITAGAVERNDMGNNNLTEDSQNSSGDTAGNIMLSLSTEEILQTIARVAGPETLKELETQEETDQFSGLLPVNFDTTQVTVEGSEVVIPLNQDNQEVEIEQELPLIDEKTYYVDSQLEQFVSGLQLPENSKAIEQNLLESIQDLWFVKAYSGNGYQAVAMLNPDTLEIQVSFINSGSGQKAFTLEVIDTGGNVVAVTQGTSALQTATMLVLTAEELARYVSQNGVSVEVFSATAESLKSEKPELELGFSESPSSITEAEGVAPSSQEETPPTEDKDQPSEEETEEILPESTVANLVQVEAVVVETQLGESSGNKTIVPNHSVFTGTFGGFSPFSLNHTIEFYIGDTLYKEPVWIASGSTIEKEGTPAYEFWPEGATAFNGWYLQGATTEFDFSTPITENLRLYGKFSNSYVITFKNADGVVIDTKAVAPNAPISETTEEVTPPVGQRQVHWYIEDKDPTVPFVFGTLATEDLILRPYFSSQYSIWFISEGSQVTPDVVEHGQKVTDPKLRPGATPIERKGYTFLHWSTVKGSAAAEHKYDFNKPVYDNMYLYATWKAEEVKYRIVYWVEDPNVEGRYAYAYSDYTQQEYSGDTVTVADTKADSLITNLRVSGTNSLRYSYFGRSETTPIAGSGNTTVNVFYNRIEYTYNFYINDEDMGPVGNRSKFISNGVEHPALGSKIPTLTLKIKYLQDVTAIWPILDKGGLVGKIPYGMAAPANADNGTTWITKKYLVEPTMLSNTNPQTDRVFATRASWQTTGTPLFGQYWLEALDGNGELSRNSGGKTYTFTKKDPYDAHIISAGSAANFSGKGLGGFDLIINETGEFVNGETIRRFFYTRIVRKLEFNYMNADNTVETHEQVRFEDKISKFAPANMTGKNPGYEFKGWYRDASYLEPFDVTTGIMPNDPLMLYAKWESTEFIVSYYDRLSNDKQRVGTQGYARDELIVLPIDIYTVGQMVPGYGVFIGWKWIGPGGLLVDLTEELPVQSNLDAYAVWKIGGFNVEYKAGRGTGTPPTDTEVYDIGRKVALKQANSLTAPVSEVFYGWQANDGSTQTYYPRNLYTINGDVVFTAEFGDINNTYQLTFKPGFAGSTEPDITWNVRKGSQVYLLDDVFANPNAKMLGWTAVEGSDLIAYQLKELITVDRSMVLYPVWEVNTHNVYFQADDAMGVLRHKGTNTDKVSYMDIPHGTLWSIAITEGTPEVIAKAGYYFTGWAPEIPATSSQITVDKTYIAQFKTQSAITLTAQSASKAYDGKPLTETNIQATGLSSEYEVKGTMTAGSTITNVGNVANTIADYKITRKSDGADVTNQFAVTKVTGKLSVSAVNVTVTAVSKTKVFGEADPALTATVTNVVAGETLNYTLARATGEDVGTYAIKVTVGVNPNYTVTTKNGVFTITKKTGGMTAEAENGGVTVVYDGKAYGINVVVSGATGYTITYSTSAAGPFNAAQPSKIQVAESGKIYYEVAHPNHETVKGSGLVTITKRPTDITADNKTKVYGSADPALTATPSNAAAGETLNYTLARVLGEDVGTYAIKVTVGVNPNYTVTPKDGVFTITKKSGGMTAEAENGGVNVVYDGKEHVITVKVTGATGYAIEYATSDTGPFTAAQPSKVNVSDSGKIFFEVTHKNYDTIAGSGLVTITKRPTDITADNKTKVYGSADPALTATPSNAAGSETLNYTLARATGEDVGTYAIKVTVGVNPNYTVTPKDGVFTITKKSGGMTAEAENGGVNVVYDGKEHVITVKVTGATGYEIGYATFAAGPFVATQPSKVNVADSGEIFFKVTHKNHNTITGSGLVTITKRDATVTADSKTKVYGDEDPALTATVTGAVVGETLNYTVARATGADVGTYAIKVTVGVNPNYTVTVKDGVFTITKKTGGMTAEAENGGVNVVYDGKEHVITVKVTGATGYAIEYATSDTGPFTAAQPSKVNVSDSGKIFFEVTHKNYDTIAGSGLVTITKRPTDITADNKTKVYGSADPALTATPSNAAGSETLNYTLARATGEDVGTYAIKVTVGVNPNYTVTPKDGVFTITKKSGGMTAEAENGGVTVVYDGNAHGIKVKVSGVTDGFTIGYAATAAGPFVATQPSKVNVVDSGKIFFEVTHKNYDTITGYGLVTITKRPTDITADNKTKVYGSADPALTATPSNAAGSETLNYTLARVLGEDVGTYAIKVTVGVNPNYTVTPKDGVFTITKKPGGMTAEAENGGVTVVYDGNAHGIKVKVSGVTDGFTIGYAATAAGPFVATQPSKVNVVDSGKIFFEVTHKNYDTITGYGLVTITKRPTDITADNKTKVYGSADPALTATPSNAAGTEKLNYDLVRDPGEDVGTYAIKVTAGENSNYTVAVKDGVFTITKKTGEMTAEAENDDVIVVYDGEAHGIKVKVTGATGYIITYATSAAGPFTATQPNKVNVADSGIIYFKVTHKNYATVAGSGKVTINKCDIIVKADDINQAYGSSKPTVWPVTVTNVPAKGDKVVYQVSCNYVAGMLPGEYGIIVSATPNNNYNISTTNGKLTISKKVIYITVINTVKLASAAKDPTFIARLNKGSVLDEEDNLFNIGLVYERDPGNTVGKKYQIRATLPNHPKYEIVATPGYLTIAPGAASR